MTPLQEYLVNCPYCGEKLTVFVDTSAGDQQYYEDCQVCCAPIFFDLQVYDNERFILHAARDDE